MPSFSSSLWITAPQRGYGPNLLAMIASATISGTLDGEWCGLELCVGIPCRRSLGAFLRMKRTPLPCAIIAIGLVIMLIAAAYAAFVVIADALTHPERHSQPKPEPKVLPIPAQPTLPCVGFFCNI